MSDATYDLVLVGGGLQNGLIALACLQRRPQLRLALVERADKLGGNHTWAIHALDVPHAAKPFVEPLIAHRWAGYDVRFPDSARTVHAAYAATHSERFAEVVGQAIESRPGCRLVLGRTATQITARHVQLDDGSRLNGSLVIDARGPCAAHAASGCGFQKFLGLELELQAPHGLARPILMDATVEQVDGFRFFYVLPLSPTRLLVEDTVFSRSSVLDVARARRAVMDYSARFGRVRGVVREETGVLPMPWSTRDRGALEAPMCSPLAAGYQGGWFHPATGYSFPIALRLACAIAQHMAGAGPHDILAPGLQALAREQESQARYAKQLNRMLFNWFAPDAMWNVFARFYTLPEALIHRFYALSLTRLDRARILVGRPPRGLSLQHVLSRSS